MLTCDLLNVTAVTLSWLLQGHLQTMTYSTVLTQHKHTVRVSTLLQHKQKRTVYRRFDLSTDDDLS